MSLRLIITSIAIISLSSPAFAGDVYVNGYYRSDGTYVRPHIRSSPDSSRANNYGSSNSSYELMNPRSRDNDNDNTPNYIDTDDDNDGYHDDVDDSQYDSDWQP